jgi:glycosyltransferase involved in cell wall biosynthesis
MAVTRIAYGTPLYFDERSYLGGGERYPLNLARGVVAAARGAVAVELVSYGEAPARHVLGPGLTLRVLRAAGRPANPLDAVSWELPDALRGADLVHLHQAFTRSSEVAFLVARQQGKPVCVTDLGGTTSPLGHQLGTLELADRVICYSDYGAALLRTTTPVVLIKGGVDADWFTPPPVRPARDRVLYVGRLLPHKGIDRLITALPPELPLTVCGRPYHHDYYYRLRALAAGKRVEFVTDAGDETIRALYRRAWVNVLPSVYQDCYGQIHLAPELMGLTVLEAMACGTPVVCGRVAALPEFVRHGETGLVFETLPELTDQLRYLASHPAVVETLGRQARQVVEREYDLKGAGAKLLAVYQELLAEAKERAA